MTCTCGYGDVVWRRPDSQRNRGDKGSCLKLPGYCRDTRAKPRYLGGKGRLLSPTFCTCSPVDTSTLLLWDKRPKGHRMGWLSGRRAGSRTPRSFMGLGRTPGLELESARFQKVKIWDQRKSQKDEANTRVQCFQLGHVLVKLHRVGRERVCGSQWCQKEDTQGSGMSRNYSLGRTPARL